MVRLQPDPFLNELTKLFERSKTGGSVWVTFKRTDTLRRGKKGERAEAAVASSGGDAASASASAMERDVDDGCRCLVRATDGKRNISTLIGAKEQVRFQAAYALVLKAHMDALKRKKDNKKEQQKKKKQQQQQQQQQPSAKS